MKLRSLIIILLFVTMTGGCIGNSSQTAATPTATQSPTPEVQKEIRPGFLMSNDPADFPFATSDYDVYVVGETHGNQEAKQLFQTYLMTLHKEAGVRDVFLEEHSAYGPDANAYVLGKTETLPEELCRRTDILGLLREFNAKLPEEEKVSVHLVDVDSPLAVIYKHLTDLHARLGSKAASIQIPPLSEMETWGPKSAYDLIADLQNAAADQPDILQELETLRSSFKWYFAGNELDSNTRATSNFMSLREEIITQNIQNLILQLKGRPLLAFFGSWHAGKTIYDAESAAGDIQPWAQRLSEAGIAVYSIAVQGIAGEGYWRGETFDYHEILKRSQYELGDGSSLPSLFDTYPDLSILYVDMRAKENQDMKLPPGSLDVPFSQVYDGLVIFKEFTPMENACNELK